MSKSRLLATAALALTGMSGVGAAQAADINWSVTVGSHGRLPVAPILASVMLPPVPPVPLVPLVRQVPPAYLAYSHPRAYRQPTRWDRDGDGIPNRHDHRYNPRWDRDGDGIPNGYDRHDNRRYGVDRGHRDGP